MPSVSKQSRELIASVKKVLWHDASADSPAVILALNATVPGSDANINGSTTVECVAKGKLPASYFNLNTMYRFMGRWDEGPRGPQFKFETVTKERPLGKAGVVKYLTDEAPNIGKVTAEKLFTRYGDDTVRVVREEPGRVQEDGFMSLEAAKEAAKALQAIAATERTKVHLFDLFAGRGLGQRAITDAIREWGADAPEVVRRNPFALLVKGISGAGFKRCDKMFLDLGKPATALKRQTLCLWNILRMESGNTWAAADESATSLTIDIPGASPRRAIIHGCRAGWLRRRRDKAGKLWIAEAGKAKSEALVAQHLVRLLKAPAASLLWPSDLPVTQTEDDKLPTEHQRRRALQAMAGHVGVLCGSPGTGKTHTLAFILRAIIDTYGATSVGVCAPTGKAAVRATQSLQRLDLPLTANTIHRMLGIAKGDNGGYTGEGWKFLHNEDNPLPFRFLIVDETSMVDTNLMASLLRACVTGTHIVFVGDPYQLPPVGHGAPLRDMIAAGIPCGELTEVKRNAGMIVHACLRIKNGEQFDTSAVGYKPEIGANLLHADVADDAYAVGVLEKLLSTAKTFHPVWQSQVIVATNTRGNLSRVEINKRLHRMLNPDGLSAERCPFRHGDKVICLKNGHYRVAIPHNGDDFETTSEAIDARNYVDKMQQDENGNDEPVEAFVANGEIGRVEAVAPSLAIIRVSEDFLVKVPIGKQRDAEDNGDGNGSDDGADKGDGCNWTHAYAITCHKCQGSEAPMVIVLGDAKAGGVACREWLYTAVSRASKLCVLIGPRKAFDRMRGKVTLEKRKTFLVDEIEVQMAVPAAAAAVQGSEGGEADEI